MPTLVVALHGLMRYQTAVRGLEAYGIRIYLLVAQLCTFHASSRQLLALDIDRCLCNFLGKRK